MKKIGRRTFAGGCLGMMVPMAASCGRKDGGASEPLPAVNVAALFDSRRDPFRNAQSFLLERLVQRRAGAELLVWDAGGNWHLQSDQLAAALAARPHFLFVFPANPSALASSLSRLRSLNPRTFIFEEMDFANPHSSLVLCPDLEVGRVAGEFVVRSLQLKAQEDGKTEPAGRIVELTIAPPDAPHEGYSSGFAKAIAQQPGITLVHQAPCALLGEDTADRVKEALRVQKDFDVIFAHNDLIARAASKTVATERPDMIGRLLVLGADGNLGKGGGKEMIIKGEIDASICRPPLVDLAWSITEKCLADPKFEPKPRYDVKAFAMNYETALEVSRDGIPTHPVE
jgi:ABC-type sugar transport system substrate-binding protein